MQLRLPASGARVGEDGSSLLDYEKAGVRVESDMIAAFWKSSFQGEFVITNELIRDLRKAKGLSQEKLGEDICTQAKSAIVCMKTERFERAETEDRESIGAIKNVGRGGCYALYFIVADTERKCYNRKHDLRYGR